MCTICKKFKRGTISVDEALEELDEQAEYLTEDHIEDIEEMLSEAEDAYDYISERKGDYVSADDEEMAYDDNDLPLLDESYDLGDEEDN
jgi:hypothetical protein